MDVIGTGKFIYLCVGSFQTLLGTIQDMSHSVVNYVCTLDSFDSLMIST